MESYLPATLSALRQALPEPGNKKLPRTVTTPHHTLLMLSLGLVLTWLSRVGCSAHQTDSWPERAVCQWGHLGMRAGAVGSCAQSPDGTESSQAEREAGSEEDLRMANVVRGSHQVQKGLESS